jgi:hypothetical protein
MIRLIAILFAALITAAPAHAKCTARDAWRGADKTQHLGIGAVIGMAGTLQSGNRWHGFAWGTGIGALKELADADGSGTCSAQDFLVTAIGAAIGAQAGGFLFDLRRDRVGVTYVATF